MVQFDLIVICVEDDGQLNCLNILLADLILTDAQLLHAEVLLETPSDMFSASLWESAVVKVQLNNCLVAEDELTDVLRAH